MTYKESTRAARLFAVLSDGEWHSSTELVRRVGHTFVQAKARLKYLGNVIEKRHVEGTLHSAWHYRLLNPPRENRLGDRPSRDREQPTAQQPARLTLHKTTTNVSVYRR